MVLGEDRVKEIQNPSMGGEDIAFFLEKVPGTFAFHPSCNPEKGHIYPHHNPRFMIDEDVLWVGPAVSAAMAVEWLRKHS
jgi:amidohydrolase